MDAAGRDEMGIDRAGSEAVNDAFHAAYGAARDAVERDTPVFVLLPESLVVHHRGKRTEHAVRPAAFHVIKAVTHAPVALFALCERGALREQLASLAERLEGARRELGRAPSEWPMSARLDALLAATEATLRALLAGSAGPRAHWELAARVGPELLALAGEATRLQLVALHAAVERALGPFDAHERRSLQVVVTGDHQARQRSLALQYFQKRLCEAASCEERVSYAEAVCDEAGALALVGTRKLDRTLAQAFFGDPRRLQRDVLGDAAAELLRGMALAPVT